ncbi:hypothetical protein [Geomicrobium sp. JCM 19055]|uniref:hypothetical protein n=1 Tax=Geomicrobium sp. JCM 19055 TaxID=1460649 RepID=UPI00045EDAC0|nr:hypothetical protein JCM19055_3629 [Geomicrobium sp. JCM 19055]
MSYWKVLLIASALFGLYGAGMGAHMAGAGSLSLRPIHAHVLVLGWLSLFAWSVFLQSVSPETKMAVTHSRRKCNCRLILVNVWDVALL